MRGADARDPCERVPKEAEGIHKAIISRRDRRMEMELSVLLKRMKSILGDEDLIESVRSILFSDRKDDVLSNYVDAVEGDLETDNMQKIFQ